MLIGREAPITYRKDFALEDAWYEEIWDSGFEPHYGIKTGSMIFEVVAVVIRQNALKTACGRCFLGANGK